jgi:hypothetical protein
MKNGKVEHALDERIAALLKSPDDQPSSLLADILAEIDSAIDHCDQTSREGRAASIDPTRLDGVAHRARAEDAEFLAARYRAGEAKLKELHAVALAREYEARWEAEADAVEARRDEIAAEFRERYAPMAAWLCSALQRISECDRAIDHVNSTAPSGTSRRLVSTELAARRTDQWGASLPISKQLKLPAFVEGDGAAPLLWPPVVQLGAQLVSGLFPRNGTPLDTPAGGILRFELTDDGRIKKIGMDGQVISEMLVDQPVVEPLHPEMSMREQSLAEEAARTAEAARYAEAGRAREAERQRLNDARENAEFARRQSALSK